MRKKYSQQWAAYNMAQTQEVVLFQEMLVELINDTIDVRKPLFKKGRPFNDLKEMLFCCVMRIYFGKSSRRTMGYLALAKGKDYIKKIPHFNTILKYYRKPELTNLLKYIIEQSGLPLKEVETAFAIDGSGFSTRMYERWFHAKFQSYKKRRLFKKAHVVSGVKTNIITAVDVSPGYHHDSPYFDKLVRCTAKNFRMQEISADAAYLSRKHMNTVDELGGVPYIMFRKNTSGKTQGSMMWHKMHKLFIKNRKVFLEHYHKRSNAESVFNMMKRKIGTHLNCKSEQGQLNELLCICLVHNVLVLIQELMEANNYLNFNSYQKMVYRH